MECIGIRVAEMPQSTRGIVVEGPNLGSICFGMPSMDNCLKDSAWILDATLRFWNLEPLAFRVLSATPKPFHMW